jgi:DNA-binding CsgD family transcriptional regulator
MPALDLEPFSALVQRWHALALASPGAGFRAAALDAFARVLPFDSAWWGLSSIRPGRLGVLQGDRYHLPPSFTADWWAMADVDRLGATVREYPGVTILDTGEREAPAAEAAFDARYDLWGALSTGEVDERHGLMGFVSLFRGRARTPFDEADRLAVQRLMPHLRQADRVHWRLAALRHDEPAAMHVAQLDECGFLAHASTEFCAALVDEFPDWAGGAMPVPLAALVQGRTGQWQGRGIEVRAFEVDADGAACCGLALRARIGQGLTPREETVARAYAAGASYKDIAKAHGLSPATVRGYLRSCYDKLGVANKAALAKVIRR